MKILEVTLDKIFPYPNNPRTNFDAVSAVAKSIEEFGFTSPIVVDSQMVIVCGHTRFAAAKQLNLKTVPILIADHLSPEKVRAFRIADNKTSEFATWDYDSLVSEIKKLSPSFDLSALGFANDVLDQILSGSDDVLLEGETLPDSVPEMNEETNSVLGKTYSLGRHLVTCGKVDKPLMANLFIASLENAENAKETIENGIKTLCDGGVFYIISPEADSIANFCLCRDMGLEIHQSLLWIDGNTHNMSSAYHMQSSNILYGWKQGIMREWFSDMKQKNIIEYSRSGNGLISISMLIYFIRNSLGRTGLVFSNTDPFGSIVIACEQTNRKAHIAVNTAEECDLIRKRWAEFCYGEGCDWQKLTVGKK